MDRNQLQGFNHREGTFCFSLLLPALDPSPSCSTSATNGRLGAGEQAGETSEPLHGLSEPDVPKAAPQLLSTAPKPTALLPHHTLGKIHGMNGGKEGAKS